MGGDRILNVQQRTHNKLKKQNKFSSSKCQSAKVERTGDGAIPPQVGEEFQSHHHEKLTHPGESTNPLCSPFTPGNFNVTNKLCLMLLGSQ